MRCLVFCSLIPLVLGATHITFPLTYDVLAVERLSLTHIANTISNFLSLPLKVCISFPNKPSKHHKEQRIKRKGLFDILHTLNLDINLDILGLGVNIDLGNQAYCDPRWGSARTVSSISDNRDVAWFATFQLGSSKQNLRLNLDTGSADLLVFGPNCTTCSLNNHTAFLSTSWKQLTSDGFQITYGDESHVTGISGTDTVGVPGATGLSKLGATSSLDTSMIVNVATSVSSSWARNTYEGLVGLGPDQLAIVPNTQTLFTSLVKRENMHPVMGFALVGIKAGSEVRGGGEVTFGGISSQYVRGTIIKTPVTSSYYWGVELTGIFAKNVNLFAPSSPPRGLLDTGTSLTYTSVAIAAKIHSLIPGSKLHPDTRIWTVPCEIPIFVPNLFFELGGNKFGFPASEFPFKTLDDGSCLSSIQGGSEDFTVLGASFIKHVYMTLYYDKASGARTVGFANRTDLPILF